MLKPFKTFLTYLQKNANSSSIFGITNANTSEDVIIEDEVEIDSSELMTVENCDDPLTDPLALDDDDCATDIININNNNTNINNSNLTNVEHSIISGTGVTITPTISSLTDLENSTDNDENRIIIVDINKLKKGCTDEHNISDNNNTTAPSSETEPDDSFTSPSVVLEEEAVEERSDGSDSGLGSEISTSTILSTTVSDANSTISEDNPIRSNLKRHLESGDNVEPKRQKRGITFDGVTVYYFSRIQGFTCVPSQGGCTLGMASHHMGFRTFTLSEYAAEQRRSHKHQLQELNPRSSSSEESDSDDEASDNSGSEVDAESYAFLQAVSPRQRRALLKVAGIRKIDTSEKDDCRAIRSSREFCGCDCRDYCDPETCACSQAGIKCQVDRPSFPCGCTRDGCANVAGRVEFNPSRVRTHFIHTIMRLELEKKQRKSEEQISLNNYNVRQWSPQVRLPIIDMQTLNNSNYYNNQMVSVNHCNDLSSPSNIQQYNAGVSIVGHQSSYNHHMSNHMLGLGHRMNTNPPGQIGCINGNAGESLDLHYAYRDDYNTVDGLDAVTNATSNTNYRSPQQMVLDEHYQQNKVQQYSHIPMYNQLYVPLALPATSELATGNEYNEYGILQNHLDTNQNQYSSLTFQQQPLPQSHTAYQTPNKLIGINNSQSTLSSTISNGNQVTDYSINDQLLYNRTNVEVSLKHSQKMIESNNNSHEYTSLHPPAINSARLDAIYNLLENNRFSNPAHPTSYSTMQQQQPQQQICSTIPLVNGSSPSSTYTSINRYHHTNECSETANHYSIDNNNSTISSCSVDNNNISDVATKIQVQNVSSVQNYNIDNNNIKIQCSSSNNNNNQINIINNNNNNNINTDEEGNNIINKNLLNGDDNNNNDISLETIATKIPPEGPAIICDEKILNSLNDSSITVENSIKNLNEKMTSSAKTISELGTIKCAESSNEINDDLAGKITNCSSSTSSVISNNTDIYINSNNTNRNSDDDDAGDSPSHSNNPSSDGNNKLTYEKTMTTTAIATTTMAPLLVDENLSEIIKKSIVVETVTSA